MARFRVILSAGVCSVALSGCLPAAAGLALSAASLVTGGGSNDGNAFRNPIDRQSTGRQVRQALSRLDDKVDPACQAMLDEHMKTYGTLAVRTGDKPGMTKAAADPSPDPEAEKTKPPVNLLAKVSLPADPAAPASDVAVSADTALAAAPADDKPEAAAADSAPADARPVKASLETEAPGPGQCQHRWACLPGTPQPTIMLMCPGKGGKLPDAAPAVTASAPAADEGATAGEQAKGEQETAALGGGKADAAAAPSADAATPAKATGAPAEKASAPSADVAADTTATPAAAPDQQTIRRGGVADWNWSFDPSKRR